MARWFTSDLHFGHANIIRFCDRPFEDAHHMNCGIVDGINAHAGPDDELWIVGDLAMGDLMGTLGITRRLTAGRIVLVAGNHDRCHPYYGAKHLRWVDEYHRHARIDELHLETTTVDLPGGTTAIVNHFPFRNRPDAHVTGDPRANRFARWQPDDDGSWLLCGHVHEKWRQRGRMINVGVDAWAGRPVHERELAALVAEGPADRDAIRWAART